MNDILWPKIIAALITPPTCIIFIGAIGVLLSTWRRWLGVSLVAFALVVLFVLGMPLSGKHMLMRIEAPFHNGVVSDNGSKDEAQAIVILGGGRYKDAPEYGEDTVSSLTLERLRYGAHLARRTNLPVIVSGGSVFGEKQSEAVLMQRVLERDFHVKPKWVEDSSRNTFENAVHTKKLLTESGIKRVYLVTHAWHMPRAQWSFSEAGLEVVPAPMGFTTVGKDDLGPLGYLPSATGLQDSTLALREYIGFFWYKGRYDEGVVPEAVIRPAAPGKCIP